MRKFLPVLKRSPLFAGIGDEQALTMLECLSAERRTFQKGAYLFRAGDRVKRIRMVLSGSVQVVAEDFWGNRNILAMPGPGEVFAESYACVPGSRLPVDVLAREDTAVLFLDCSPRAYALRRRLRLPRRAGTQPGGHARAKKPAAEPQAAARDAAHHTGQADELPFGGIGAGGCAGFWKSPLTDSSWPITWLSTEAPCPRRLASCATKAC